MIGPTIAEWFTKHGPVTIEMADGRRFPCETLDDLHQLPHDSLWGRTADTDAAGRPIWREVTTPSFSSTFTECSDGQVDRKAQ